MAEPPPLHRADTAAALGSLVAWFHLRRWQRTASATPEDAAAAYEAAADALIAANSRASESSAHATLLATREAEANGGSGNGDANGGANPPHAGSSLLDVVPTSAQQRTPVVIGSRDDVSDYLAALAG